MAETITAEYLIVGTGAMGMAFVDTLVSDTKATVVMVDRYARPGGHWKIAYPYVGWNKGLVELATVDEVCAYYSINMHETFLPSGRVKYFPKHEYMGEGEWRSIVTGKGFRVGQETTIVDATYMKVKVPERGGLQPGLAFAESTAASVAAINGTIMAATSPEDLFLRLEACTQLTRMTDKVWPTMFPCATVFLADFDQIKKIGNIVRQGRVVRIGMSEVTLESGTYEPVPDTLYIDCSADALAKLEPVRLFRGKQITLQSVRYCQQVFSAAFIAGVDATYDDDKLKNELCRVVPHPDEAIDYMIVSLLSHRNGLAWAAQPKTAAWLAQVCLNWFGTLRPPAPKDPAQAADFYAVLGAQVQNLCAKLEQLLGQLPEKAARAKAQMVRL